MEYKTDIEIASETKLTKITDIAKKLNIDESALELYGKYKAKLDVSKIQANKKAKLILVTAINPTKAGEGKSTTTIGLADSMNKINKQTTVVLREPSLGPVFGLKGGATGGGYAQVVPMEDINLHFTGDMHAITCANNLISACLDNHLYQGNELNIDKDRVVWKRCLDMNDRSLRQITIGQGKKSNGVERKDGFIITVASEIMAVLCLASDIEDLKERLANMLIAYTLDNQEVYVRDLKIAGALAMILKDAIKPNLVQTLEKTPAIIHGGPFANIAHGCNSIIATKTAMKLSDYVVTEAGFGADLGAEKFLNIKCREAKLKPNGVVIVATVRALKLHGNVDYEKLSLPNVQALLEGTKNLAKHIDSIKSFNLPYVVCINRFVNDSDEEIVALENWCKENNHEVSVSNVWECGSAGGIDLAKKVVAMCDKTNNFSYTYELSDSIENKIAKIAKNIYGASGVIYSPKAMEQLKMLKENGYEKYMVCMAKTPLSLTDNPKLLGRPIDFKIHIQAFTISRGAKFIVCLTGKIMKMPGLPKVPAANNMDIKNQKITGLF